MNVTWTHGCGVYIYLDIPLSEREKLSWTMRIWRVFSNDDFNPKRAENHKDKFAAEEDTQFQRKTLTVPIRATAARCCVWSSSCHQAHLISRFNWHRQFRRKWRNLDRLCHISNLGGRQYGQSKSLERVPQPWRATRTESGEMVSGGNRRRL